MPGDKQPPYFDTCGDDCVPNDDPMMEIIRERIAINAPGAEVKITEKMMEAAIKDYQPKINVGGILVKDSGKHQQFDSGARRDSIDGKGRFDLLPMFALEEVAKLFEAGARKYAARNWERGMPLSRYADSALRHLAKAMRGQTDEAHLVAACWNLLCLLDTKQRIALGILPTELDDLPKQLPEEIQNAIH